jgi:hypothetical protein
METDGKAKELVVTRILVRHVIPTLPTTHQISSQHRYDKHSPPNHVHQAAYLVHILEGVFLLFSCGLFALNIKVLNEIRHVVVIILSGTGRWPLLPLLDGLV